MMKTIDGIPVHDVPVTFPPGARDASVEGGFTEAGAFKIKWMQLREGEVCMQHSHIYPHATLVISGIIRVFVDGENKGVFLPMAAVHVAADKHHYMMAEADSMYACIHFIPEE